MDPGLILYSAVAVSVLLPLGARFAGNRRLANRLDLLPRLSFGTVCLLLALLPGSIFSYTDDLGRITGPASPSASRVLFGILGVYLLASAVRIIVKRDYDRPDADI